MEPDIWLHNPHSALATLQSRPQDVLTIQLGEGPLTEAWIEVKACATQLQKKITVVKEAKNKSALRGSLHQVCVRPKKPVLFDSFFTPSSSHRLLFACDQVQDPQNLGAIFRSLAFFNAKGLILLEKRAASLSSVVYDIASGGVESLPFCIVGNLRNALEEAKKKGFWILGTSEHAPSLLKAVPCDRSWLVVLGNEHSGLRPLTQAVCDQMCRIPSSGNAVGSLNVAIAASIFAYHFS